jgi:MEMO1 family protein
MKPHQPVDPGSPRPAAVAGQFYPNDPVQLSLEVERFLAEAKPLETPTPKAVVVPHAGYTFSGPIAGTVYACLQRGRGVVRRVVLVGPSHYSSFPGLAASSAQAFATPLGTLRVDQAALGKVLSLPQVTTVDAAHRNEHSLEVQLPFLQTVFHDPAIVPLLVGEASSAEVSEVLEVLWGGPETCLVISSDLSHYHNYQTACQLDRATARAMEDLDEEPLHGERACGSRPIRGLLRAAKAHHLRCQTVDLRNSGDLSGRRDRVVGYGGFVFTPA